MTNTPTSTWRSQAKTTIFLAIPILFAHLIEGLIPFINTYLSAQIGEVQLAASGLAGSAFFTLMGLCWGILTSVGITSAYKIGAKREQHAVVIVRMGILLSIVLGIPVMVAFWHFEAIAKYFGQAPDVAHYAGLFFRGLLWGVIADIAKFSLFQYAIAIGQPRIAIIVNIISLPILYFLNNALIFGHYGLPKLGIMGIGLGTSITYWLAFCGMLAYLMKFSPYPQYSKGRWHIQRYLRSLSEMIKLGIPIGMMFLIEIALFMVISFLMGHISTTSLAAHQIAIQFLGVTILIAFGFSEAVTILVSKNYGAKDPVRIRQSIYTGTSLSLLLMTLACCVYWFAPLWVIDFDVDIHDSANQSLIAMAILFIRFSAIFQFFDSIRIVVAGALRGLKDTQYPMWVSAVCCWGIGLPASYFLAFKADLIGNGLWYGLIIAVVISAIVMVWRLRNKLIVISKP